MSRRIASFVAVMATVLSVGFGQALTASAATGPWSWTDMSGQIEQQNRPVWAMAYAAPYWYFTDGQELWNGGHVWKTEGSIVSDITVDVRNAGISRVDDIITDGTNIIFLKNIYRLDNAVEAVRSRDGGYANITTSIRSALDGNEGISSLVGRNGTWMMVSTRARLVRFSENFSSYVRLTAPSEMKQYSSSDAALLYSAHDRMDRGGISLAPTGNKFLLSVPAGYLNTAQSVYPWTPAYYVVDGSTFQKISLPHPNAGEGALIYNQNTVLTFVGITEGGGSSTVVYFFDGTSWTRGPLFACSGHGGGCSSNNFSDTSNFTATWDGSQWLIISGKKLFRLSGSTLEQIDTTRDYFVTAASDGNGTILLGGVASDLNNSQPTNPLTAKLVKMVKDGGITNTTQNNTTVQNGISYWSWFTPNQTLLNQSQTMTFNIGAWSTNGLKRIEISVNGSTMQTCNFNLATGNQTCAVTLNGANFPLNTTASMNAKITDGKDQVAWTPLQNIQITNTNNVATVSDVSAWTTFDPSGSTLNRTTSVTFRVNASASQGLSRIDVYANGSVIRTCNFSSVQGTQTCDTAVYGGNYVNGQVSFNALATDVNGKTAWSDTKQLTIQDTNSNTTNNTTNTNGSSWIWSTPDVTTLNLGDLATFHVGANDADGIKRIEMYVNGNIWNTCNFSNATGNQECTTIVSGNSFAAGTDVFVNAKITDANNNLMWSSSRTYHEANTATVTTVTTENTTSNAGPSTWVWAIPPDSNTVSNSVTYHVGAWDTNGMARIEIWVDGTVRRVCTFPNIKANVECSWDVFASDYTAGREVYVNAKTVDANNNITWAASKSWRVQPDSMVQVASVDQTQIVDGTLPSNLPGWISVSSNHDAGFHSWDHVTYTASAGDGNGIDRIELYVNAVRIKVCYNTGSCAWTGGSYPGRNSVAYGATIVDKSDNAVWTGYKTIKKI